MYLEDFVSDIAGFPMIWVPTIKAYVHWTPVLQCQYFAVLSLSEPFLAFHHLYQKVKIYFQEPNFIDKFAESVYLNDLSVEESELLCTLFGEGYTVPTVAEWDEIYRFMCLRTALPKYFFYDLPFLSLDASILLQRLGPTLEMVALEMKQELSLADQMLMGIGAGEWLLENQDVKKWFWVKRTLLSSRLSSEQLLPVFNKTSSQNVGHGLRLLLRP